MLVNDDHGRTDGPTPSAVRTRWLFGTYDYPVSHRVVELVAASTLLGFGLPWAASVWRGASERISAATVPLLLLVLTAAYAAADLASGTVHHLLDNHGSPDTPVIGQKFVKPFRDHHVDPLAMTHGDFIAVNADNMLVTLPVVITAAVLGDARNHPYLHLFALGLVVGVVLTNQIHKWAHLGEVPRTVRWLQHRGVILSPRHHAVHHSPPYDANYCITWGVVDVVLNRVVARR